MDSNYGHVDIWRSTRNESESEVRMQQRQPCLGCEPARNVRNFEQSRVEPVRQKMAGPIGHRREKEMKCEQSENIYKKFTLHSEPAEVDEVAQMRFPAVLVFSSIHPISKIFVATISNQLFFPTVCRTSGIARPRRSPSQYTFNPSVRREARHIPCELPIMSADRLRPRFDTGQ